MLYTSLTRFLYIIYILIIIIYNTHRAGLNERALLPIIPSKTSQYTYIIYCVPLPREMFWADRRICYIIFFFLVWWHTYTPRISRSHRKRVKRHKKRIMLRYLSAFPYSFETRAVVPWLRYRVGLLKILEIIILQV